MNPRDLNERLEAGEGPYLEKVVEIQDRDEAIREINGMDGQQKDAQLRRLFASVGMVLPEDFWLDQLHDHARRRDEAVRECLTKVGLPILAVDTEIPMDDLLMMAASDEDWRTNHPEYADDIALIESLALLDEEDEE